MSYTNAGLTAMYSGGMKSGTMQYGNGAKVYQIPHTTVPLTREQILRNRNQKGGNPAVVQAVSGAVSSLGNAAGKIADSSAVTSNNRRSRESAQGIDFRKASRNQRFAGRRNLDNDLKMASKIMKEYKERGIPINPSEAMRIAQSY